MQLRQILAASLLLFVGCTEYVLKSGGKDTDTDTDSDEEFIDGNPHIQLSVDLIRYGVVPVGCPVVETITISNSGSGTLVLEGAKLSGDPDYVVQPDAEGNLQPGDAQQFNVFFEPQIGGPRSAEIEFRSNDNVDDAGLLVTEGAGQDSDSVIDTFTQNAGGTQMAFPLTQTPLDVNSIVVEVQATVVPANLWSYDPGGNAIEFDGGILPQANDPVNISYLASIGCD